MVDPISYAQRQRFGVDSDHLSILNMQSSTTSETIRMHPPSDEDEENTIVQAPEETKDDVKDDDTKEDSKDEMKDVDGKTKTKTTSTKKRTRTTTGPPTKRQKKNDSSNESGVVNPPMAGFMIYDHTTSAPLYRVVPMMFTSPSTMVPFSTAPMTTPMEIDIPTTDESKEKKKEKAPREKKDLGAPDFAKYMERVRTLIRALDETERPTYNGRIVTEKQMPKRFKNLTVDELKFVQKENMSNADLDRLKQIAEKVQYHGFFLKYVFGKEGIRLGRFVNESVKPKEPKDSKDPEDKTEKDPLAKPDYVDNTPDDLQKRAQGKVIYIGEVSGPGIHRPTISPFRMKNEDFTNYVPPKGKAKSSKAVVVTPIPTSPKPTIPNGVSSPTKAKRSPGRPPKSSVPPPQAITKNPANGNGLSTSTRTSSVSLVKQVADQASKAQKRPAPPPPINGFDMPGDN